SAIRGGVPVCFPQFADQGPLPMHGFARVATWTLVGADRDASGAARASFRLTDDAHTRSLWPHAFSCELDITAIARTLRVALRVTNAGRDAFDFTMALHTYLRIGDVHAIAIDGLADTHYRDKVLRASDVIETNPALVVDRPIDRVYRAVPKPL